MKRTTSLSALTDANFHSTVIINDIQMVQLTLQAAANIQAFVAFDSELKVLS